MTNKILYLVSFILLGSAIGVAQSPENPELALEISRLFKIDQNVQTEIISAYQNGTSKEKLAELFNKEKETFKNNVTILKSIVHKYGVPTFELVGKDASREFFVMVQHADADIEFQKAYLEKTERFVKLKQVSTDLFAYLTDRVNVNEARPQIYGTQLEYDKDGNALARKVKDPKNLNKRRASVGLGTIEEYLKKATELHKRQNKTN